MRLNLLDLNCLSFRGAEVYIGLLEIQHTLERNPPNTDAVRNILKRRAYELLDSYERIPLTLRAEAQQIRPLDVGKMMRDLGGL